MVSAYPRFSHLEFLVASVLVTCDFAEDYRGGARFMCSGIVVAGLRVGCHGWVSVFKHIMQKELGPDLKDA